MLNSEGHFDPHIREAFIKSIGIFPCGSCVLMESGRLAIVVDQNDALLAPRVRIFSRPIRNPGSSRKSSICRKEYPRPDPLARRSASVGLA